MAQDVGDPSPLDDAGTPWSHQGEDPRGDGGLSTVNMGGPRQLPLAAPTPGPSEGVNLLLEHHPQEEGETFRQRKLSGDCCCGSQDRDDNPPLEGETIPENRDLTLRASHRADCGGKDSRSSGNNGGVPSQLRLARDRPLFCSVGVHGRTPNKPATRKHASSGRRPQQQQQNEQHPQQSSDAAAGDSQREGDEARTGVRCTACGTLKVRAPIGFTFLQNPAPSWGQLRMATCSEAPQGEASAGPGASVPLGTSSTQRKQLGCEDCAWMLPIGGSRGSGPYHLLKQQQQPKQGEFVAGSLQWGHPTSFWLVESVKDEGVEREFRRLFRINSPDSRIALSSFRLLVTFMVVLAALKYGVSTYFPPAMKLVGLSAIFFRTCILLNVGGLGTRVFDPDSLEWRTGIANDFILGDVQIALVDEDDAEMRLLWGNLVLSMFTLFTVLTLEGEPGALGRVMFLLALGPGRGSLVKPIAVCQCALIIRRNALMRWVVAGWNNVATATAEKHPFSRIFFVAYICFTTLTLLNIVTGIILDAYVDMSNRLLKEANYKDDLEKDVHNEKVLLSAFEKTSFLVCMRPAVSTFSSEGSALTTTNFEHTASGWAGGDSGQDSTIPTLLREGETATTWRHAVANSSMVTQAGASASQSPRAPMCPAGAHFERKLTGVASEDSTARPSTESAADSEPIQIRTHVPDTLQLDGINVRTCVRYLRIGGHQPMDILRDPVVQEALQAAHIPFYQAFDVLSMFHQRGIQFVTVKEFAEACSRVVGSATGRQLLQVQLELQQKLCALEQCIRSLTRQKQFRNSCSTMSKLDLS
ncbi:Chromosome I, complete genome, related [Eimeria mitis]|uniref:Chromosome I, complete genome, related n=1 Tax=Eimeria mitis TaxID=44415 RepID=U6JZ66_9EIME|nr:Chromosome I, complete genome, related [Eimeria mitis]CDJ28813.1 Chromosome I, complete genome, related [Eimeria mitis]